MITVVQVESINPDHHEPNSLMGTYYVHADEFDHLKWERDWNDASITPIGQRILADHDRMNNAINNMRQLGWTITEPEVITSYI